MTIELLKQAEQDMEAIYSYIAEELQSPQVAMGQFNSIAKAIQTFVLLWRNCLPWVSKLDAYS